MYLIPIVGSFGYSQVLNSINPRGTYIVYKSWGSDDLIPSPPLVLIIYSVWQAI